MDASGSTADGPTRLASLPDLAHRGRGGEGRETLRTKPSGLGLRSARTRRQRSARDSARQHGEAWAAWRHGGGGGMRMQGSTGQASSGA